MLDKADIDRVSKVVAHLFPDEWEIVGLSNRTDLLQDLVDGSDAPRTITTSGGGAIDCSDFVHLLFAAAAFVSAASVLVRASRGDPDRRTIQQQVEAKISPQLLKLVPKNERLRAIELLVASNR